MGPPDLKSLEINRIMTGWIGSDSKNVKYNKFIKTVINFINLSDSSVKSTEVSMALLQRDSQNLNSYYWLFVRVTYSKAVANKMYSPNVEINWVLS